MPVVVPSGLARFVASSTRVVALIPARYRSTRFPGKPLAVVGGRTMIEHVYRRVEQARRVDAFFVATDDERIAEAVDRFGGVAIMTRPDHETATDRLAEVAADLHAELIVNVQGDEPLISPAAIDAAVGLMQARPDAGLGTLRRRMDDLTELDNPHVVKVVVNHQGDALYFTRAAIPYVRSGQTRPTCWRHIGLYVYRRDFLLKLASLAPTALERAEGLEQLRALEHGFTISTVETDADTIGVDTPEDLERVRQLLETGTAASKRKPRGSAPAGTPTAPASATLRRNLAEVRSADEGGSLAGTPEAPLNSTDSLAAARSFHSVEGGTSPLGRQS